MKQWIKTLILGAALLVILLGALPGHTGEGTVVDAQTLRRQMERLEKLGAPGEAHAVLQELVGEWSVSAKFWLDGPDAEPVSSSGEASYESILGGRFVRMVYEGDFLGKPFHGVGVDGYDNYRKRFIGTWADDMSTTIQHFEGECDDADCRVRTMTGVSPDPLTGKTKTMKGVTTRRGPDEFLYESFEKSPGGEFARTMEARFTRQ